MRLIAMVAGMVVSSYLSPAWAAKVTGRVVVSEAFREALAESDKDDAATAKNYYWNQPNGIIGVMPPPVRPASDLAVVAFKQDAPPKGPDDISSVDLRTGSLERNVVVTSPGSTIRFINVSPFNHELYSPQLSSFKPEVQSTKAFRAIEFKEEGVYEVRCKLMPHLLAYVVVTGGKAIPLKADGSFADELEPGKYTLKVFHGGKWVHQQSIDTESSRSLTVQLKLEPGEETEDDSAKGPKETEDNKENREPKEKSNDN
jgi:hypothetical protein